MLCGGEQSSKSVSVVTPSQVRREEQDQLPVIATAKVIIQGTFGKELNC